MDWLNNKVIAMDAGLEDLTQEVSHNMVNAIGNISGELTRALQGLQEIGNSAMNMDNALKDADRCVRNLNQRLAAIEAKPEAGRSMGMGLIDPKLITVNKFDPKGDAGSQKEFVEWRDLIEKLTDQYHVGIKAVLEHVRRVPERFTEQHFEAIKASVTAAGHQVRFQYARTNYELGVYLLTKVEGKAKITAEAAKNIGGFEMFRLLHQRYDRVTVDMEAMMMADIAKLGASQATSLKQLRDKLATLQSKISEYEQTLGKSPSTELLGSILTCMLDGQTRREFVHIGGVMGNFEAMRDKITRLANDCGPTAMDIGLVDKGPECMECKPCTPEPGKAADLNEAAKRPFNPELICWHCNEKGHPAALCPNKHKPPAQGAKGYPSKGMSKGGGKGPWMGNKGAGGKGGKGGGGKGPRG